MSRPRTSTRRHSRGRDALHVIVIAVISAVGGYALAISLAKSSAPKQTVYQLPHDFGTPAPTFLPSALRGGALTTGTRVTIFENGEGIFPPMLAAVAAAQKTVN